jgi:hypothetical protein
LLAQAHNARLLELDDKMSGSDGREGNGKEKKRRLGQARWRRQGW